MLSLKPRTIWLTEVPINIAKWTLATSLPQPLPVTESSRLAYLYTGTELDSLPPAALPYVTSATLATSPFGLLATTDGSCSPGLLASGSSFSLPLLLTWPIQSASHVHCGLFQMPLPLPMLSLISIIKFQTLRRNRVLLLFFFSFSVYFITQNGPL